MKKIERENKINASMRESIRQLSELIDVNTVVGTPIKTEDSIVIPITKITFCMLAGGGEYGRISIFNNGEDLPFSTGNGSIVSIKPYGFLVKNGKENFKVLSVTNTNLDGIIDKTSDLINNLANNLIKED